MENKHPQLNLRVFRRDVTDMILIYDSSDLKALAAESGNKIDYRPKFYINGNPLDTFLADPKERGNLNDICILIPYQENGLNSHDEYMFKAEFYPIIFEKGKDPIVSKDYEVYSCSILVRPMGSFMGMKDNAKMYSQCLTWDVTKERWLRTKSQEGQLLVTDLKTHSLLEEILKAIKK